MTSIREMMNRLDEIDNGTQDFHAIADEAFNEAVRYIQDKLGQTTGDWAGQYFADDTYDTIVDILADYARSEVQHLNDFK